MKNVSLQQKMKIGFFMRKKLFKLKMKTITNKIFFKMNFNNLKKLKFRYREEICKKS